MLAWIGVLIIGIFLLGCITVIMASLRQIFSSMRKRPSRPEPIGQINKPELSVY